MGRSTIGREMEGAHAPSLVAAPMEEGPRRRPSGRHYRPRLDLRRQHPRLEFRRLHPRPWQGVMEDASPVSVARRSSQTRRPMPHEFIYTLLLHKRIAAAVWSSFAPLSLFRNVRCLSDMERARELLGLRKSIARLQDARMHMSLSSILGTDLHMIKPLQALALMVIWYKKNPPP